MGRKQTMFRAMLPNGGGSSGPGEIQIGSIPSTPNSYGTDDGQPFDGYYEYSISLQIYTASELGNTSRTFNKIAFYLPDVLGSFPWPPSVNWCDQSIILAHTTQDYLTTSDNCNLSTLSGISNTTTVKSSFCLQYNVSGGTWVEHSFDTNFNYNGSDNLLVKWVNEENDYWSGGPYFGTTTEGSVGTYRAGYARSGSSPVTNDTLDNVNNERNNIKLFYI